MDCVSSLMFKMLNTHTHTHKNIFITCPCTASVSPLETVVLKSMHQLFLCCIYNISAQALLWSNKSFTSAVTLATWGVKTLLVSKTNTKFSSCTISDDARSSWLIHLVVKMEKTGSRRCVVKPEGSSACLLQHQRTLLEYLCVSKVDPPLKKAHPSLLKVRVNFCYCAAVFTFSNQRGNKSEVLH